MGNVRTHISLPADLHTFVTALAKGRGVSLNRLLVDAVEELRRDSKNSKEEFSIRFAGIEKRLRNMTLDLESVAELLSLYIFHWFCYTPPISDSQKSAIFVEAKDRHSRFLKLFKSRLEKGELDLGAFLSTSVVKAPLSNTDEKKEN